ncbi:hypothetical protein [Phascolarctobacterium faecium]|uniref:hypothetical protein n=1 Tax=Phascolarctobacterium faecium TaxID=33025 RepID=UPI003AB492C9
MANIYIVEGDIEEKFLYYVQPKLSTSRLGKIRQFNLMQNKLSNSNNILNQKYSSIFCIIDTDCITNTHLDTFIYNIKLLKTIGSVTIFVQNKNFEDELLYVLNCKTISTLCQALNLHKPKNTKVDLKKHLSQKEQYQFITKQHLKKYCSRPSTFQSLINQHHSKTPINIAPHF